MVISDNEMHGNTEPRKQVCDESDAIVASSMHSLVNMISGEVTAIHQGLLNVGVRVRIGKRTDLRVRWPLESRTTLALEPGTLVKVVIPGDAVHLESGFFRLGKGRWNRWIGRIVLVEAQQHKRVVSVKLHHDAVTLRCCGSMTGSNWNPSVWDTVNIVVDPSRISLDVGSRQQAGATGSHEGTRFDPFLDTRVWLRAQVIEAAEVPDGKYLSLLIGTARVSVFIRCEEDNFGCWKAGMTLEIHVGRFDACLKPCGSDRPLVPCGLLYLDSQALVSTR